MVEKENLHKLLLHELEQREIGLRKRKNEITREIVKVRRVIARKKGELADSPNSLFPDQKLYFESSLLGNTGQYRGYSKRLEERDPDTPPEVIAYYCTSCHGYIKGKPKEEHVLVGEPSKERAQEVRLFCEVCNQSLGILEGSRPERESTSSLPQSLCLD